MSCIYLSDGGAAFGENRLPCCMGGSRQRAPVDGAELQSIILISRAHVTMQAVDWQCIIVFRCLPLATTQMHTSADTNIQCVICLCACTHLDYLGKQTGAPLLVLSAAAETNPLLEAERVVAGRRFSCSCHLFNARTVPADDAVCPLIRHLFARRLCALPLDK